jgi:hypothetical protein
MDDTYHYDQRSYSITKPTFRGYSEPKQVNNDGSRLMSTFNNKNGNITSTNERSSKFDFSRVKADHQDFHNIHIPKQNLSKFELEKKELKNQTNEIKNIFEHLYKETSTNDIEELVDFIKVLEEEKSKLYFETQNMLEQIELLKDTKFSLQLEIKEREDEKFNHTNLKEKAMEEFNISTHDIDAQIDLLIKKKTTIQSVAKFLSFGIITILERAAFGNRERIFISNLSITNETVPYYLHMLEKKTNKILKIIKDKNLQEQLFQIEREPEKKQYLDEKIKEGIHLFEEIVSKLKRIKNKER